VVGTEMGMEQEKGGGSQKSEVIYNPKAEYRS
jgi:hypothetical protein